MLQFSEFVWALSYLVWDVFNIFLFIDATDRSKISSVQKRFFIALSLYPLSFFANTPFKIIHVMCGGVPQLQNLKHFEKKSFKSETSSWNWMIGPFSLFILVKENRIYIRVEFRQSLGMNLDNLDNRPSVRILSVPFSLKGSKVYKSCKCSQIICSRVH